MTGLRATTGFGTAIFLILALLGAVLGAGLSFGLGGCGSEPAAVEKEPAYGTMSAEEIMAHLNAVEGELGQPVEGQLKGEVMATAASPDGEESWMLLRVDSFRPMGVRDGSPQGSVNVPAGSEVSIRYRETAETEPFSPGDVLSIHIRIVKSKNGPMLVAMDWYVIQKG